MPPAGHALWAEVGGVITFVTSRENTSKSIKLPVSILGFMWVYFVFFSSLSGTAQSPWLLCMYGLLAKGAPWRNCRQKQNKTSFSPLFCLVRILGNGIGVLYFGIVG